MEPRDASRPPWGLSSINSWSPQGFLMLLSVVMVSVCMWGTWALCNYV